MAWSQAFGNATPPTPRLDKADLLVGLGAEFLDRPDDGFERDFAARRSPDQPDGGRMSRFIQFEGRLTLTGANADKRIRVRDSHLAAVAASLAHELIVVRKVGPLAADVAVATALAPFAINVVAGKVGVDAGILEGIAGELAAAAGKAIVRAGGSAGASASGPALELAAILLNVTLGAYDAGLFDENAGDERVAGARRGPGGARQRHAGGRRAGAARCGCEPGLRCAAFASSVGSKPSGSASVAFADALENVPTIVSLNDRLDETTLFADTLAPASHPFESWGDVALPKGLFAIQQPVAQPLFDTRGLLDLLIEWGAALGDPAAIAAVNAAAAAAAKVPVAAAAEPAASPSAAWHYLRGVWATRMALDPATPAFGTAWNEVLKSGAWQGPIPAGADVVVSSITTATKAIASSALALFEDLAAPAVAPTGLELQLYPHLALEDGRSGNNGWLQEFPDPITRITWGGALSIAPRRFDEMRLTNGDLVEVDAGHATLVAPAYRHAGMHHDQIALPLGLGRTACGVIGNGIGPNAFPLRVLANGRLLASGLPVTIRKAGGHEAVAFAQAPTSSTGIAGRSSRQRRFRRTRRIRSRAQSNRPVARRRGQDTRIPRLAGRWRSTSASATAAASASSGARPRTTSLSSADKGCSTAARCRGCGSIATRRANEGRPVGRRRVGWSARGRRGPAAAVRADALPALRGRGMRDRLPLRGDDAQRGRVEPADLQPLVGTGTARTTARSRCGASTSGSHQGAGERLLPGGSCPTSSGMPT